MVGAEHADTRTKLGTSQGDHVLSDVSGNNLAMLRRGVVENPLDEVVAILITRDVDEWDACTIATTLTDSVQVAAEEV
ncbi:unnamed protein product [Fusarium graminearum]|nr:unnamed protein product [Fusarium graminearum]CAG1961793.1 unnamed protein product [Fusarium graminearum]VTO86389.1 unnamed protein product [Fusarium graminearum]